MLDRNTSTADQIAELVRQLLAKRGLERAVDHHADLSEAGLSSLDTVNLMLAVEAEFDVKIPERDMTPGNFRSVARIEALVGQLRKIGSTAPRDLRTVQI
ncbi:MAG TPA: phosphopantetheine-binding protein [Xanthobacteraceae bacterium]|nr:phosphopantetheine-binding protein [Xanthobacteraceae bacterium]